MHGLAADESRPVIVVGMASHENAVEHYEQEVARAEDRADKLVAVSTSHFRRRPHIYSLNLGAYQGVSGGSDLSVAERRMGLLVINEGEQSPDFQWQVREALLKAWNEHKLSSDPRDYSLFAETKFEVRRRSG